MLVVFLRGGEGGGGRGLGEIGRTEDVRFWILGLSERTFLGLVTIDQVGPLQQHQYHPSGSSHGIQAQNPPIGPIGVCQSPFPGFIGMGEHFQSFCIPGDGLPSNYGNACQVTGYPPSSSMEQIKPCHFLFSTGSCKKGENCLFSHGTDSPKTNSMRQVQTPESLPMLEKVISELLLSL